MTKTEAAPVRTHHDHRALMERMDPNVAGWRGCAGVALILGGDVTSAPDQANGEQAFIKNGDLTWMTGLDVPVPWMKGLSRTAHLIQARTAVLRFGSPQLEPSGVLREFDYWDGPTPELGLPDEWALAADGLNNAMTSTAFAFRAAWGQHRGLYRQWAETQGDAVILGGRKYDPVVVKDFGWVPKPWIGVDPQKAAVMYARLKEADFNPIFKAVAADLFAAGMPVTSPVRGYFSGTSPLTANGMRYTQFNFREENGARHAVVATGVAQVSSAKGMRVYRGTQVGSDAPPLLRGFYALSRERQWAELVKAYRPEVLDLVLGNVFSSLFRQAGKAWLLPFAVVGQDVSYSLGTNELWWDVSPIHSDERDFSVPANPNIHIMPTMRMGQWDSFKDHLGHTVVDLTPTDQRFRAYALGRQIKRKFPRTTDGYSGDAQGEVVPVAVVPGRPLDVMPVMGDDVRAEEVAAASTTEDWDVIRRTPDRPPVEEPAHPEAGKPDDGTDDPFLARVGRSRFWRRIPVEKPVAQTRQSGKVLNDRGGHIDAAEQEARAATVAETAAARKAAWAAEDAAAGEPVLLEHGVPPEEMAEERWEDDGGPAPADEVPGLVAATTHREAYVPDGDRTDGGRA